MSTFWEKGDSPKLLKYQAYKAIHLLKYSGPYTSVDLAHELKCHVKTASRHLREMWALDLIYISAWDRNHHTPIPAFAWGKRKDIPQPTPYSNAEKAKRRRERAWREAMNEV